MIYSEMEAATKPNMTFSLTMRKLLDVHTAAQTEINARFQEIFLRHRGMAFAGRKDQHFNELWTPDSAASKYEFAGYEINNGDVVLHGMEQSSGYVYRISISFPMELLDQPSAIDSHFEQQSRFLSARRETPAYELGDDSKVSDDPCLL
jgi:hypothetical protein